MTDPTQATPVASNMPAAVTPIRDVNTDAAAAKAESPAAKAEPAAIAKA